MKIETYTEKELITQKNVSIDGHSIKLEGTLQEVFHGIMNKAILGKVLDVGIIKSDKEYPYYAKETKYYIPAFVVKRVLDN